MWQSLVRVVLLIGVGYGVYMAVPAVEPLTSEMLDKIEAPEGTILGKTTDYVDKILGKDTSNPDGETTGEIGEGKVIDNLIEEAKDSVTSKVQEDVNKVKEGVQEAANEQFCKTVLKTLEEECGGYYCSE
jgi:hypothetical protein